MLTVRGLGEGCGPCQQAQWYGLVCAGLGQHRQPEGGIEGLRPAGINVVAEEVEATAEGQIQVGVRLGPAGSSGAAAGAICVR